MIGSQGIHTCTMNTRDALALINVLLTTRAGNSSTTSIVRTLLTCLHTYSDRIPRYSHMCHGHTGCSGTRQGPARNLVHENRAGNSSTTSIVRTLLTCLHTCSDTIPRYSHHTAVHENPAGNSSTTSTVKTLLTCLHTCSERTIRYSHMYHGHTGCYDTRQGSAHNVDP